MRRLATLAVVVVSFDVADGGVRAVHVWRLGEGPGVFARGRDARARWTPAILQSTASMVSVNSTGLPHRRSGCMLTTTRYRASNRATSAD